MLEIIVTTYLCLGLLNGLLYIVTVFSEDFDRYMEEIWNEQANTKDKLLGIPSAILLWPRDLVELLKS